MAASFAGQCDPKKYNIEKATMFDCLRLKIRVGLLKMKTTKGHWDKCMICYTSAWLVCLESVCNGRGLGPADC